MNKNRDHKNTIKDALAFTVILLPFAAVGGYFTGRYTYASYTAEVRQMILEQVGSVDTLALISMAQTVLYTVFCAVAGYMLAGLTGLMKPLKYKKEPLLKTVFITVICGVLFSLDDPVFGTLIPQVAASYKSGLLYKSIDNLITSVLYGGIVEELILRLFLMSLVAFVLWKLFFKKYSKEEIPAKVFVIANVICALLFAAGHLPATISMFGELSFVILCRCFLMNGALGFVFGELYRKYGIQYAFIGHMGVHVVSKVIWNFSHFI